ncbi:hypothetical protein [Saccharicrinis fermentans]|uniref:Lipoprotein n=1 Tax=Saccharicrinis fermentans DSM 9555 = JCM 21142 TaxID=869213 RepID=W7Y1T5_9BACT|nr:hypothetical protein [Saccharicrinis fermentans]GAF01483.1 hypothetical protein JCM21142_91 [Saccharicrinis fermentans DSM 9555 = JCM 21142]
MKHLILLISLIFILCACASKRYVKKASLLENSGLYSDAANNYFNSLQKNINNIDAKLGLKRTGQLVLDDKIENFKSLYQNGSAKEAVYAYRSAEDYLKKIQGVGIKLIFPEEEKNYYREVEDTYLNQIYGEAIKALQLDQFTNSEKLLAEILTINNNYKDAKSQWIVAKYEPIYRTANEQLNNNMYRSAYFTFKTITDHVKTYENSLELMNYSLKQAKVTIYISAVSTNLSAYQTIASQLNNKIIKGITDIQSPLYEVVGASVTSSQSNTAKLKAFMLDRTKGVENEITIPDSKALFEASIQKYTKDNGRLVKTEKKGYLKRTETYMDKTTQQKKTRTVYDKVKYYEYYLERKANLTVSYSMKRRDRDEIIISNAFNKEEKDIIHYAYFEGDYKKIVPGTWKYQTKSNAADKVYDDASSVNKLRQLFEGNRTAKTLTQLENTLMNNCVAQITQEIKNYQPEN